jgi:hypothetical protein
VQYTVRSKGRAIGVTDLGFVCHDVHFRMGWFHPNEVGERLMPHVSALHAALRASNGEYDESIFTLDPRILEAEKPYEEALRRVEALELTLHREDGTRVKTENLAISDTELLVALNKCDDETFDEDDWRSYEELRDEDDPFELSTELDEMLAPRAFQPIEPWQPDERPSGDENVQLPRFQIYVHVVTPLDDAPVVADDEWWRKHGDW